MTALLRTAILSLENYTHKQQINWMLFKFKKCEVQFLKKKTFQLIIVSYS